MKIALTIFVVIMTLFVMFGRFMPLEKIRPYIFSKFKNKFANILINTIGAIIIVASIFYLIFLFFAVFMIPQYIIIPSLIILFILKIFKEKK
jgi:hypothetical protein